MSHPVDQLVRLTKEEENIDLESVINERTNDEIMFSRVNERLREPGSLDHLGTSSASHPPSNELKNSSKEDKSINKAILFRIVLVASIGGLLFGYDIGVVAGALLHVREDIELTSQQEEGLVSLVLWGGVVGVAIASYTCERFGRRFSLSISAVVTAAGSLLMALSPTAPIAPLLAGRAITGVGVGIATVSSPLYIAEISPPSIRGALVATSEVLIVAGMLLAALGNWLLDSLSVSHAWRISFGFAAVPALLQFILLRSLPLSPRWLALKGRLRETKTVLLSLRADETQVEAELAAMAQLTDLSGGSTNAGIAPCDCRRAWPMLRATAGVKALVRCTVLAFLVQFTGQPSVLYYSTSLLANITLFATGGAHFALTVIPLTLKLLATCLSAFLFVDRLGRRPPLIGGLALMIVSLLILAITATAESVTVQAWGLMSGLCLYVVSFAIGLGPSELYPPPLRALGQSLSMAALLLFNALVAATFLTMTEALSLAGVFGFYAVIALFGIAFVYFCIPETQGLALEDAGH